MEAGIPAVFSVGALDMVNFNNISTVPSMFAGGSDRVLFVHNEGVTLMRTNTEENIEMGQHMVSQLSKATRPIALLIPEGGVSVLDQELGPGFYGATFDNWQKIKAIDEQLKSGGISQEDRDTQVNALKTPWEDKEADAALFKTLEEGLSGNPNVKIVRVPHNLNTTEFAAVALEEFKSL